MTDVVKFINDAIDAWYVSGQKISPKGFVFKKGRDLDGNFHEIEVFYNDPNGPLVENPDWGMIPIFKAKRDEVKFGPNADQLYSTIELSDRDKEAVEKVIKLASS